MHKTKWNKPNSQNKVIEMNSHIDQYARQVKAVLGGKLVEFKGKSIRLD